MSGAVNVTDARPRGFFMVDNAIIAKHGKALGAYGVAVYSALCMYADRGGRCTPSYRTIGGNLDISSRQVMREIDKIVGLGLASVEHRPTGKGNQHQSNVYTLLPVGMGGCDSQSLGCDSQSLGVVTHSHTNKTQENKTQEQDIPAPVLSAPSPAASQFTAMANTQSAVDVGVSYLEPPAIGRAAPKAARRTKPRPRNAGFDAFCEAIGVNPSRPGRFAGLAQEFATLAEEHGITPATLQRYKVERIRSGDWAKFDKPHNLTTNVIAWKQATGTGRPVVLGER